MMRLFVALDLPDQQRQSLAALCCGIPGMKWVSPDSLHLTLRFIGEVDEAMAEEIDLDLSHIKADPLDLTIRGLGSFGSKRPDHLWAGLEPNPALHHLAARIESTLQRLGLPAEPRRYTPHITLGRSRLCQPDHVHRFMLHHEPLALPTFQSTEFHLFQSHLGRNGPQYQRLCSYNLT